MLKEIDKYSGYFMIINLPNIAINPSITAIKKIMNVEFELAIK